MVALDGRPVSSRATDPDAPRPATIADVPEVIALVDAEMRAGTDQSLLTDYPLVYAAANLHNVRIIRVDGELASVVPVLPRRIRLGAAELGIGVISPTATAPAHRHRGYASQCLASCLDAMREADCALSVLWTRVETFPFYERAGYRAVASQGYRYHLEPRDAALFEADPSVEVVALGPADAHALDAIRRMHERDGDGIHRKREEYGPLFSLPKMRTLLARRDRRPVGYVVVSAAVNKPGLIEAGGDIPAIEVLVSRALADLPAGGRIDAHANRGPTTLSIVLDRRVPFRRSVIEDGMMLRINDVARVLRALGVPEGAARSARIAEADWPYALFGSHAARPYQAPDGLAVQLGIPLPVALTLPVLDRS
jgi:predicted N-acetyltransferase YhbS